MSRRMIRAALALVLLADLALAADVPVSGTRLDMRVKAGKRSAVIVLRDPAIVRPFFDPANGASLVVSGGILPGQCRVELAFDARGWRAIGPVNARIGFRYRPPAGSATSGIRRVVVKPGVVMIAAGGPEWPCALTADRQRLPLTVALTLGQTRYCAAFDGANAVNRPGRLRVRKAAAPATCPDTDLTVANLNILHGLFCPAPTSSCRLEERIDLLFQWIVAAGCPDVVTLQEVRNTIPPLLNARRTTACPFPYEMVYVEVPPGIDDEVILSRYPAVAYDSTTLHGDFRHVLHARIDHPIGPLDVFTTHLASGGDQAQRPCDGGQCPEACVAAGATTLRECQATQVRALVEAQHDVATPAVITGDLNEPPTSFVHQHLTTAAGWTDTYLAAGNPECEPSTGVGCTAGRIDDDLTQLESATGNESERIDYVILVPPGAGSVCAATIDGPNDADGDGTATRIFADQPNPFGGACGPAPAPICWPSDHEGAELDLDCG